MILSSFLLQGIQQIKINGDDLDEMDVAEFSL